MALSENQMRTHNTQLETPKHLSRLGFINKVTLQLTFDLLREQAPRLALLVQNVLMNEHLILRQNRPHTTLPEEQPTFYRVAIEPEDIVKILGLLTELGQNLTKKGNSTPAERKSFQQIIRDWSYIGDWIIKRALGSLTDAEINLYD